MQIHITRLARLFLPRTFLSTKELLSKYWLNQWRNSTRPLARQNRTFELDDHKGIGVMKRKHWCWQYLYLKRFLACIKEAHISLHVCFLLCSGKLCPRTLGNHQGALVTCGSVTFSYQTVVPVQTQLAVCAAVVARANPGYFLQSLLQQEKICLVPSNPLWQEVEGQKDRVQISACPFPARDQTQSFLCI